MGLGGKSAYPQSIAANATGNLATSADFADRDYEGLTIREVVALAAMQGFLSADYEDTWKADELAEASFRYAEAWLAEAQKRRENDA